MSMFVKSKFGGSQHKEFKKARGLEDGESLVFRFVPPLAQFNMDESGWAMYHKSHWGYKGTDRKNPGKTQSRTFRCTLEIDYKTKRVKVPCSEHAKIEEMEQLLSDQEAICKAQGKTAEEMKPLLDPIRQWIKDHNVDAKWYANVITEANKLELLKFPHKGKQAIEQAIREYREKLNKLGQDGQNWDPNDPTAGCWFRLKREGTGNMTNYLASIVEESVSVALANGSSMQVPQLKLAPLTEEHGTLIKNEAQDLNAVVRILTSQQIDRLVACSGSPEEVDAIFNQGEKAAPAAKAAPVAVPNSSATFEIQQAAAVAAAQVHAQAVPTTPAPAPAAAVDDEEAALLAKLAEARARKAAAAAAADFKASAPAPAPVPAPVEALVKAEPAPEVKVEPTPKPVDPKLADVRKMDDKSFLALFGKKAAPTPAAQ